MCGWTAQLVTSLYKTMLLDNNKNWEDYWKNNSSELIHFIGKDNIVFHCIIFPIILKLNKNFNLPTNVPNEFLNLEGKNYLLLEIGLAHEYLEEFKVRKM